MFLKNIFGSENTLFWKNLVKTYQYIILKRHSIRKMNLHGNRSFYQNSIVFPMTGTKKLLSISANRCSPTPHARRLRSFIRARAAGAADQYLAMMLQIFFINTIASIFILAARIIARILAVSSRAHL